MAYPRRMIRKNGPADQAGQTKYEELFMQEMETPFPAWRGDAECSNHSPEMFFYESPKSLPLLEQGLKVCDTCIVKDRCLEAANESDKYWGIRGGVLPTALGSGRIPSSVNVPVAVGQPNKACIRGHVNRWKFSPSKNTWRCKECERLSIELRRAGEKMERIPAPDTCPNGHNNWAIRVRKSGKSPTGADRTGDTYRECKTCKVERSYRYKKTGSGTVDA